MDLQGGKDPKVIQDELADWTGTVKTIEEIGNGVDELDALGKLAMAPAPAPAAPAESSLMAAAPRPVLAYEYHAPKLEEVKPLAPYEMGTVTVELLKPLLESKTKVQFKEALTKLESNFKFVLKNVEMDAEKLPKNVQEFLYKQVKESFSAKSLNLEEHTLEQARGKVQELASAFQTYFKLVDPSHVPDKLKASPSPPS